MMAALTLTACGGGGAKQEQQQPAQEEVKKVVYAVEAGSAGEAAAQENGFEYNAVAAQADALCPCTC